MVLANSDPFHNMSWMLQLYVRLLAPAYSISSGVCVSVFSCSSRPFIRIPKAFG